MSFILDALKKSENERQRQSGPGVFQPRIASPRARFPLWAIAIGALLVVNLLILIWLMTRADDQPGKSPVGPPATAPSGDGAPAPARSSSMTPAPAVAAETVGLPSAAAPSSAAPPSGAATPFNPPLIVDPALTTPAPPRTATAPATNPNDYVPAQPPGTLTPSPGSSAVAPAAGAAAASFATRESLLARGQQVPEVALSLHVYDADPARRFVFVNGQRAVEGETLPSGMRIEQIVPEGAVLSWNGSRFLVPLQ